MRATQLFEFVNSIAHSGTAGEAIRLPPVLMQPVVSEDVAAILADIALLRTPDEVRTFPSGRMDIILLDEIG